LGISPNFELKRNRLAVIGEDGKLNIKNFLKRLLILSLYYGANQETANQETANQETKEIQDSPRNGRKLSRYILKEQLLQDLTWNRAKLMTTCHKFSAGIKIDFN
jgi:hypothetical protein